ncbi:amylo-alpha-1,6-glucosidase [Acidisphaera rubrifaciens]|uniref:Amylo-alpha-16-glucosidase n=1 Tax=Acidisphaera rubrifaciens HS-AP3 TaxID=1231350 RepID=A0A0D6P4P6_9PROT|nr:glycogen debranching N-terminal domain-containing protein [Acidisphaera rubrifaciens]GAN76163.1 amylo-alpha-16-glucosidase [Acidisphaera rubrifaciens HS-AP3]
MDDRTAGADHPESFAIATTASLQELRPRVLKYGDTFAVFDRNGDMRGLPGGPEGLYHRDTRYLSRLELLVAGVTPIVLSSTLRDDNAMLTCDLTNPDFTDADGRVLEHDLIHVRRSKFLFESTCHERIGVRNYAVTGQRFDIELRLGADFADLFEVRGSRRARRGRLHPPRVDGASLIAAYTGLDDVLRETRVAFDPPPDVLEAGRAVWHVDLPPGGSLALFLRFDLADAADDAVPVRVGFGRALRLARRRLRQSSGRATAIVTSNEIFNEGMRRAISDITMLITDTPQGPYPYAGIPWYSTAFGRDALITALETLWLDPEIARGVLGFLAANQATGYDAASDAEPGKILHETRAGEMADLGEVPFRRYYGSVDSTPLFIMLAGAYLDRTNDTETLRRLWPNIDAALGWMDGPGDPDGDGFIEYARATDAGLANQGWKDSYDSIFHADGTLAEGPIALVEVQGYAHAARLAAARIARRLGDVARAETLTQQAHTLRQKIDAAFWSPALDFYALALDGKKRPCLVRASNAGHLLLTGTARHDHATRVAGHLLDGGFFSGWGIRTVAAGAARYNPMSYHNGSVWPHDNALIGIGLARYGMRLEAARILDGLFDASTYIELRRVPELFCGFRRRHTQGPTYYPVACAPQAWSAMALPALLAACLGITFDPARRTVIFNHPVLPRCLSEVRLTGLAIGDARLDVVLRGARDDVAMRVTGRRGDIHAIMVV